MHRITLDLDVVGVDGQSIFDPRLSVLARRGDSAFKSWLLEPWQGPRRLDFESDAEHLDFSLQVGPQSLRTGDTAASVRGNASRQRRAGSAGPAAQAVGAGVRPSGNTSRTVSSVR